MSDTERLDWALAHSGFYAWRKSTRHDGMEMVTGSVIKTREEMDEAIRLLGGAPETKRETP